MSRKEDVDYVRDKIHTEMIRKELRLQKLHTDFHINPFRKLHILPDKPVSRKQAQLVAEDSGFIESYKRAQMEPMKKYPSPVTESQEIGWILASQITSFSHDPRFDFRRATSDVTKHSTFALRRSKTTKVTRGQDAAHGPPVE